MKQTASTQLTFFWKFVFPGMFAVPFGIAAVSLLNEHRWVALLFGVVALHCGFTYIWFCPRYMVVEFDDEFLYVSNALREIRVPWTEVEHIKPSIMSRWPTYAISFRGTTDFGGKIYFSIPFRPPFGFDTDVVLMMQSRICKETVAR